MIAAIEIREKLIDGVAVLYPGHYLNQLRGESIENRCCELLMEGYKKVVINFEDTELINSIGISILLGIVQAVCEAEGVLALSNLNASSRELFEALGLATELMIEATEEAAIEKLNSLYT